MAVAVNARDGAVQLVAGAGAQHQAAQQLKVLGFFGGVQYLALQHLQPLIKPQHTLARYRQPGTATALAPHAAFHQGGLCQIVQFINGLPRGLVTDAGAFGGSGDRTLLGDVLQQRYSLWAADDVLRQQGRQMHVD